MKNLIIIFIFLILAQSKSYSVDFCDNIKIVSVHNFPPSPDTPGGNYFLLLLTVKEDNPGSISNYANLYFNDENGTTISYPTGPSSLLPVYTTDTIPYVMELITEKSNQDFPLDFNGELIILDLNKPDCAIQYTNTLSSVSNFKIDNNIDIFPNPVIGNKLKVRLYVNKTKEVTLIDMNGTELHRVHLDNKDELLEIDMSPYGKGIYFLKVRADQEWNFIKIVNI